MSEMVKALLNGEYEIIIPKHRADRPEWYKPEGWEKKRLASMHSKIGKGDIVYYVGAEEGEMPALCQMWGAEVVLFEPNDKVWANIKAIWEANNLQEPLFCIPGFASNEDVGGELYGRVFPLSANGEVIGNHGFKELWDPGEITQIRIDTLVERTAVIPTAIILDVEGSEWEVLKGAEETIKAHKPKIWLSGHPEFLFDHYGKYLAELRKWIKDFGYKEELLDYQHEVHLYYE